MKQAQSSPTPFMTLWREAVWPYVWSWPFLAFLAFAVGYAQHPEAPPNAGQTAFWFLPLVMVQLGIGVVRPMVAAMRGKKDRFPVIYTRLWMFVCILLTTIYTVGFASAMVALTVACGLTGLYALRTGGKPFFLFFFRPRQYERTIDLVFQDELLLRNRKPRQNA